MLPGLPSWGLLLSQVAGVAVAVLGCCRCAPGVIGAPGVVAAVDWCRLAWCDPAGVAFLG